MNRVWGGGLLLVMLVLAISARTGATVSLPEPAVDDALGAGQGRATAVLAGGCFWGIEAVYKHIQGVVSAAPGYAGGSARSATYDLVSTGSTGHAESVKVVYDPAKISYGQLLKVFFSIAHDPTQKGGQGPDLGPQYRSVIFFSSERQQAVAKAYMNQLRAAQVFGRKEMTTELVPLTAFYDAEPYHQNYAARNPTAPYILMWDRPKVEALRKQFPGLYVK